VTSPTLTERVAGSARLHRRQRVSRGLCRVLGRIEFTGHSGIPPDGPVILAVNHRSLLDGPLLFGFIERPVACLVKREAFVPIVSRLLRDAGQIPVQRETVDPLPVHLCLQILRAGGVIGVFPEGTRGDGLVRRAKAGVGYFALRTAATVIPIACHGTAEMVRTARRHPVRLTVGAPLTFGLHPPDEPLNRRFAIEATERVRAELAALVERTAATNQGAAA
jgi:1-acyl-sn-glycerol-3-phosphate acyltransferase